MVHINLLISIICVLLIILIILRKNVEHFNMLDLSTYEKKIFSQNGEDGVLIELLKRCYDDINNKYYVEFGVENGTECNSRVLREHYNWKGLMMDGGNENEDIGLKKEFVYSNNIIELFKKYDVPTHIHVLIVDTDYNDAYILHKILQNYTADILICEINPTHLPHEDKVVEYKHGGMWDVTNYYGASLLAYKNIANHYKYSLVYHDKSGTNAFFIRDALLKERNLEFPNINDVEKIYNKANYCAECPNGGHRQDPHNRPFVTSQEVLTH